MSEQNEKRVKQIMDEAKNIAMSYDCVNLTSEHLTLAILQNNETVDTLKSCGLKDPQNAIEKITTYVTKNVAKVPGQEPAPTIAVTRIIKRALAQAILRTRKGDISPLDIVLSMFNEKQEAHSVYYLKQYGLMEEELRERLAPTASSGGAGRGEAAAGVEDLMDPTDADEILAKFTTNLNIEAENGNIDPIIGRAWETAEITAILARKKKNNAILIGDPGVGKTAIAEGLALRIASGDAPKTLEDATIFSLDITAILAGSKYRGDVEERLKNILNALATVKENGVRPVLFIDEIHMMIGAGSTGGGGMDIGNMLKPHLSNGLSVLAGTTHDEYEKHFDRESALKRRFTTITVEEPTVNEAIQILTGLSDAFAEHHGVKYTPEAITACVKLTDKYINDRFLPDKAIDVLDSTAARLRTQAPEGADLVITQELVENELVVAAKIPASLIDADDATKVATLESALQSKVFGQDEAVKTLTKATKIALAGLRPSDKTQGNFLFVGPTGTGKTEITKQLGEHLGLEVIRYDMSEFMEAHSVSKLLGAPPGYVGHDDGAKLVQDLRRNPHCILLLDEFEKAHPKVRNVFLGLMDAGHITDSKGTRITCRNVTLIMTSNAGAAALEANPTGPGADYNRMVANNDEAVIKKMFTPEFRNRIDAIVKFKALERVSIEKVLDKFIAELEQLIAAKGISIALTDAARDHLIETGYQPALGARPMHRAIHNNIKDLLADEILFTQHYVGDTITFDCVDGKFNVVKPKEVCDA